MINYIRKIKYIPNKINYIIYLYLNLNLRKKPKYIEIAYKVLGKSRIKKIFKTSEIPELESQTLKSYDIFSDATLVDYKLKVIEPASYEQVQFPRIFNFSDGGRYGILFDEVSLYHFENAVQHPYSDFIRVGGQVFWDKLSKPQFRMIIPQDKDMIVSTRSRSLLSVSGDQTHVDCGFSLLGVHANSWGHFIGNFLPKLNALEFIEEPRIDILIPEDVDDHIRQMVEFICSTKPGVTIRNVKPNNLVFCAKLYYCTSPSFIADHSEFLHPSFVGIREYAKRVIFNYANKIVRDLNKSQSKKLFISRNTGRNINNYEEIEEFFTSCGFEVVHPHLLSFEEKFSLFAQASHVAGPGSSGFLNLIFCQRGTKALVFSNYSRTLDLYPDLFMDHRFFGIEFFVHLGVDKYSGIPHSDYYVDLGELKSHLDEISYLEK